MLSEHPVASTNRAHEWKHLAHEGPEPPDPHPNDLALANVAIALGIGDQIVRQLLRIRRSREVGHMDLGGAVRKFIGNPPVAEPRAAFVPNEVGGFGEHWGSYKRELR